MHKISLDGRVSPLLGEVVRSARGADRQTSPPALNLYNLPPTRSRKAFAQAAQGVPHKKANAL
ncbi:MAG: hypothetical protein MR364_01975 [Oscillospiraceae bacterium]|nr:hypothetical protein [Oscillospiraceae bacterium]